MRASSFVDVVPGFLGNLKRLSSLNIRNTPIANMTSQLTSLRALNSLHIYQCSLTQLPNLSELEYLYNVYLQYNRLTQLTGLSSPYNIGLDYNNFTELPVLASPETLSFLIMRGNPLKHVLPISSFVNIQHLDLRSTSITFIPPNIDKLQSLNSLDLSYTKVAYFPKNILKLSKLRSLYAQGNNFGTTELSTIQQEFNRTLPNCTLYL